MNEADKKKALAFANAYNILDETGAWKDDSFTNTAAILVGLDQFEDPLILDLIRFSLDVEGYVMNELTARCMPLVSRWLIDNVQDQDTWLECFKIAPTLVRVCPDIYKNHLEVAKQVVRYVSVDYFPHNFRSDKGYMIQALRCDPENFNLASEDLQNDDDFRRIARRFGYKFN